MTKSNACRYPQGGHSSKQRDIKFESQTDDGQCRPKPAKKVKKRFGLKILIGSRYGIG